MIQPKKCEIRFFPKIIACKSFIYFLNSRYRLFSGTVKCHKYWLGSKLFRSKCCMKRFTNTMYVIIILYHFPAPGSYFLCCFFCFVKLGKCIHWSVATSSWGWNSVGTVKSVWQLKILVVHPNSRILLGNNVLERRVWTDFFCGN